MRDLVCFSVGVSLWEKGNGIHFDCRRDTEKDIEMQIELGKR